MGGERGDDGADAGELLGGGGVYGYDVGVGVGAAEDGGVEHPRQLEVGGVVGLAG